MWVHVDLSFIGCSHDKTLNYFKDDSTINMNISKVIVYCDINSSIILFSCICVFHVVKKIY